MIRKSEQDIMLRWKEDVQKPVVSICCMTYNHEAFIQEAIESFLNQETDFAFEVLIHDDASTDQTAEIIREYERKYPKIIKPIYQTENQFSQGRRPNIELNIPRARGDYIAFCEGDDYWVDTAKLQKQVNFLEKNKDYVMTYSSVEAFNENGIISTYIGGSEKDLNSIELQNAPAINTLTVCFRNVIKEFPREYYTAKIGDVFVWSLLGAYGKGKFLSDIKPSRYRVHNGGIFSKKPRKHRKEMRYITLMSLYAYYRRIGQNELSDGFHKRALYNSIELYGVVYYQKAILTILFKKLRNFFGIS